MENLLSSRHFCEFPSNIKARHPGLDPGSQKILKQVQHDG